MISGNHDSDERLNFGSSLFEANDVHIAAKFVRYQEGAELYSIGLTKFQELAKEAKAVYKIDKVALVNCEIFEKYLETFRIA